MFLNLKKETLNLSENFSSRPFPSHYVFDELDQGNGNYN